MGEHYLPRPPTTEFGGAPPNDAPTIAPSTPASKNGAHDNPNAFLEHVTCRLWQAHPPAEGESSSPVSDAPCNSDRGFWMTACGHVLCDKGHEHKKNICTFCGKSPISTFIIGGTGPESLRGWFASPSSQVAGATSRLSQAVEYVEHIKFQVYYMESKLKKQKKEIARLNGLVSELEVLIPKYSDAQSTIVKLREEKDELQTIINRSFDQAQQPRQAVFTPARRTLETVSEIEEHEAEEPPPAKRQRHAQNPIVRTMPAELQHRPASVDASYSAGPDKPAERRTLPRSTSVPAQEDMTRAMLRNYAYGTQQPPSTPVPREQASFALHTGTSHPMMEGRGMRRSAPFTEPLRANSETRRDGGTPVHGGRPSHLAPSTPMGPPALSLGGPLPTTSRPAFQGALPKHMQAEMQNRTPGAQNLAARPPGQSIQSR